MDYFEAVASGSQEDYKKTARRLQTKLSGNTATNDGTGGIDSLSLAS